MPEAPKWTDEQRRNAMLYGVCFQCGTPREAEMIYTDGVAELRLDPTTCPHAGDFLSRSSHARPLDDVGGRA